jgi:hypothetical protein
MIAAADAEATRPNITASENIVPERGERRLSRRLPIDSGIRNTFVRLLNGN